jgi:hypothetical protein
MLAPVHLSQPLPATYCYFYFIKTSIVSFFSISIQFVAKQFNPLF